MSKTIMGVYPLSIPCPYCQVPAGNKCTTINGYVQNEFHQKRREVAEGPTLQIVLPPSAEAVMDVQLRTKNGIWPHTVISGGQRVAPAGELITRTPPETGDAHSRSSEVCTEPEGTDPRQEHPAKPPFPPIPPPKRMPEMPISVGGSAPPPEPLPSVSRPPRSTDKAWGTEELCVVFQGKRFLLVLPRKELTERVLSGKLVLSDDLTVLSSSPKTIGICLEDPA